VSTCQLPVTDGAMVHGAMVPPPNESWKYFKCGYVVANNQAANDGLAMVTHLNREERRDNLLRVYHLRSKSKKFQLFFKNTRPYCRFCFHRHLLGEPRSTYSCTAAVDSTNSFFSLPRGVEAGVKHNLFTNRESCQDAIF
jgi:hypothetical protein